MRVVCSSKKDLALDDTVSSSLKLEARYIGRTFKKGERLAVLARTVDNDIFYKGMDLAVSRGSQQTACQSLSFNSGLKLSEEDHRRYLSSAYVRKGEAVAIASFSCMSATRASPDVIFSNQHDGTLVYRVEFLEKSYAIKAVNPKRMSIAAFLGELNSLKKISHPNILKTFGGSEQQGWPLIIMEDVKGIDLYDYIMKEHSVISPKYLSRETMRGIASEREPDLESLEKMAHAYAHMREIARQMLSALVELEKRGVIHRDLKPENILIIGGSWFDLTKAQGSIQCKLFDFGFMKSKKQMPKEYQTKPMKEDPPEKLCGSLGWLAPEVLMAAITSKTSTGSPAYLGAKFSADYPIDCYAAGLIIYTMVTGGSFQKAQEACVPGNKDAARSLHQALNQPLTFKWYIPIDLRRLIGGLLERSPEKRLNAKRALEHSWFQPSFDELKLNFKTYISNYILSATSESG